MLAAFAMGKVELRIEVDAEVLAEMQVAGVPLDALVEARMREALEADRSTPASPEDRARAWALENAEAIREHNAFVDKHGLLADHFRNW